MSCAFILSGSKALLLQRSVHISVSDSMYTMTMEDLPLLFVWTVVTIDWPSGVVTPSQEVFDCTQEWSGGCQAEIP